MLILTRLPEEAEMNVAVIGAGRIGGGIARQLRAAGHSVTLAFARDQERLKALADEIGATTSTPRGAAAGAEVVVLSVPWSTLPEAIEALGPLDGRIVVDTTNQYGGPPLPAEGQTAASFNRDRLPGARYTKSFNTLTSAFQAESAGRPAETRVVQWICGDDAEARQVVARLIQDAGFAPVDLGGCDTCAVMEAPRRPGAVYGEEWRLPEAEGVVEAVRAGRPIPPTPDYSERSA
jgi:predicted dinucleotide-binding enzyme